MFLFRVKRTIKLGAKSLWMHRLRSILTTLGVVFGVCSVIAMLAIGEGASRQAQEQIAQLGSCNLIVKTVKPPQQQNAGDEQNSRINTYGLTYNDAERFRSTIADAEVIVPLQRITQQAWYRNRTVGVEVIGTVPWYTEVSPIRLKRGRFLSSIDLNHQQKVCVVDEQVIEELFVVDEAIGKFVKIKDNYYHVVGVASAISPVPAEQGLVGNSSRANDAGGLVGNIYVPLTAFKSSFGELSAQFSGGTQSLEKVELREVIVKVKSIEQVLPTRDVLGALLRHSHKKKDYQIVAPLELLRQAARTRRIFSVVLGSIAAISLLVGGIGIMNIMLSTVSERTREIGIRRALGARRRDIIAQFLSETVMLTLLGGILGIILGSLIPYLVTHFADMPTVITAGSLTLAFGISATVGIAFGLYPACRAANMDPIESLRHE